ncbi:MAG: type II secretion system protein [Sideroxyarcus sp.]|nr:type II secretion system protein [Sideroxyarcus sp.]
MNSDHYFRTEGFTLVEMAIVLAIMALILGTGLTLLSAQQDQRRIEDTKARLDIAQEALIGYAISHNNLPCPADPTIPGGTANAGIARDPTTTGCTGGATALQGDFPWATLGLPETDAWGHRFTYRVSAIFARSTPLFTLSDDGNIDIGTSAGSNDLANNMPAVIVSHGINGLGAYTPAGKQITPVPVAATNEGENADNDGNFVSRTLSSADEAGGYFDDQVIWISRYTLFNRMVLAGNLP